MKSTSTIIPISLWDQLTIQFSSLLIGVWVLCKRCLKKLWNSNSLNCKVRNEPPKCLIDNKFGLHKHKIIKETKFHYVEAGVGNQDVILLLHGFADFWLTWRYQIPIFANYFHVIALDLKGFGDSEKPAWRNSYEITKIVTELKEFIDSLHANSCIVIGHDLGGILGWFLIHQYPEIVDKFIAVSSPHPNLIWKTLPNLNLFNLQWIRFAQLPFLPETDVLNNDLKIINIYHKHLESKEKCAVYLEAYKYTFSRLRDWVGPINYFRNLPFVRINTNSEEIKTRTLLVTGKADQSVDLEAIVQSTYYCEKFVLKIIDGAAHFPHQENPDMFNREILKFLKVDENSGKVLEKIESKGIMNRMLGAVSYTMKYSNYMFDSAERKRIVRE